MGAITTMNPDWVFWEIRPVGEAISMRVVSRANENELRRYFPDPLVFYQSGTAALAAALMACKSARHIDRLEVVLPAYACPDLLSAINYAGLRPVMVDFEKNRPWISIADLKSKVNAKTLAVIAVNFLGITERMSEIRRVVDERSIFLIEDRAQSLDGKGEKQASGDLILYSFGKGKPVALLHGGALMIKRRELDQYVLRPEQVDRKVNVRSIGQLVKMIAYNLMIHPRCYWILKYIPILRLGETRYKPLTAMEPMKNVCLSLLAQNIRRYYERENMAVRIHEMLASLGCMGIIDLPEICGTKGGKMLRYPVLFATEAERDACLRLLKKEGLGASAMYPGILPTIKGTGLRCKSGDYPNAKAFAARLLTLPLHSDVTTNTVNQIAAIFRRCEAVRN